MTCITKETSFVKMRIFCSEIGLMKVITITVLIHLIITFFPKDKNVTNPKTLFHYFSTEKQF